jgi:hypothetical protein
MDEELEQEFMDTMGDAEEEEEVVEKATPLPNIARPPERVVQTVPPARELALPKMMMAT